MQILSSLQSWIVLLLSVVALGVEVYAFVDCVRRRPDAFTAAGKRTKSFWLLVTVIAMLLGIVSLAQLPGILAIVAVIAAGVYLADVKPALDQVMGRGGRTDGPYGPW
jgi:Kef-type K+ transport system membrane component KefB